MARSLADLLGKFSSERLNFRRLEETDAADLQRITNDSAITDAISFLDHPFDEDDAKTFIAQMTTEQDCSFGARLKTDGDLVLMIGAHFQKDLGVEIGYWVATGYQGKGFGGEAASALVQRVLEKRPGTPIFAEVAPENLGSAALLKKIGFRSTGEPGSRPGRLRFEFDRQNPS